MYAGRYAARAGRYGPRAAPAGPHAARHLLRLHAAAVDRQADRLPELVEEGVLLVVFYHRAVAEDQPRTKQF